MYAKRNPLLLFVLALALTAVLVLTVGATHRAQAQAGDLFFSEYVEGSSNNKALEIYNGTGAAVDLAAGGYNAQMYFNGNSSAGLTINLTGTVADGDVFVLAQSSAAADILAQADQTNGASWFNGNDAVLLRKGTTVVDAIGQVGFDPGSQWGSDLTSTADNTLRRKADICAGDTDETNAFDPSVEWDGFAQNTFDGLGSHTANCGGGSTNPDVYINELRINKTGAEADFFEIQGPAGTSLDGLTYVVISGEFEPGQIDFAFDLTGANIPADGFFVAAGTAAASAYGITPDLSIEFDFFGSPTTHLIVSDFTGAAGNDLDSNNDGTLDVVPWSSQIDSIAFIDGDTNTDYSYSNVIVGPDGSFTPAGAYRCGDAPSGTFDNNQLDFDSTEGTPGESNAPLCQPVGPTSGLVINEIHADPAGDISGDANGDGTRDAEDDEFVEIVNNSGADVDISGWTLSDGFGVRHTFPTGSTVTNGCAIVLFGGGTPIGSFGNATVQTASTGALGFNNGGDTVTLNNGTADVASYSYGSEGGDNQSLTLDPDVTGTPPLVKHTTAAGANGALYSPGTQVDGSNFSGCAPIVTITFIHDVQGSGGSSPLEGQTVTIEGIVVGDFQDGAAGTNGDLNGFNVQEEDGDADSNPATSEGIFVFDGNSPAVNVAIGDKVQVAGQVAEFNSLTELSNVTVTVVSSGNPAPTPATVTLPVNAIADLEAFEGMSVTFSQTLYINEFFNFDRFGEIVLGTERFLQPTAVFEPGSTDAANLADLISRSRITLDDGRTAQNPDPAIHPNGMEFTLDNRFRGGDTLDNVTGVLDYSFDLYRVQPTQGAVYTSVNTRTATPDDVGGNLKVASFNVLNYFSTIDTGADICGPQQNQECRGADNETERIRQLDKIVSAMAAIDADVLGIIEVENTTGVEAMDDIVAGLNDVFGAGAYAYVDTGTIGTDAIKVGFIYKTTTVSLVGSYAVLDTAAFVDPNNTGEAKNRPALAQTFIDNETGGVFTAVVNHLKSKGSPCGPGDDDPEAGSCNLTRTLAAQELLNWLATDPTGSGDADFLIVGDLNSYDKEDPIDVLLAGGFTDLVFDYQGENAYSYVFDGQLGYLDYGMANADLAEEVTGTTVWHINADEPDLIDYDTTFKEPAQDALYEDNAYRSSDHDPVIVGLAVCDEIAPTLSVTMSPNMLWPPNHKYVTVSPIIDVADNFDTDVTVTLLSVESNEPDNGLGDGDTPNDIVINGDGTVDLRAERSGTGDGRIYTFTYEAVDDCGNSTIATATVTVPKSQGRGK